MLERTIVEAIDLLDEIYAAIVDPEEDDPVGSDLDAGEYGEAERDGDGLEHREEPRYSDNGVGGANCGVGPQAER